MSRRNLNFFALLMFASSIYALDTDKEQIIYLKANNVDINQATHQGHYDGEVEFNQGSSNLHALNAKTFFDDKNKLIKAIAWGNNEHPAHFWTTIELNKPDLHAYAEKITYIPAENLIKLKGKALIKQGPNSFSSPFMVYNTQTKRVFTKKDNNERTTIIIYPEKKT